MDLRWQICVHGHVVDNEGRCRLCEQTVFTMSSEHPVDATLTLLAAHGSRWYLIPLAFVIVVSMVLQVQPQALYTA